MDIHELRAEVRKRQQAANAKVSRLRRKGVQVAGTDFDIRRDPVKIGRYNVRQLGSYLRELNSFTARGTSFVGGSEGAPIPRQVWNRYKQAEKQFNAIGDAHYDSVSGTFIPISGMTVVERDMNIRGNKVRAKGEAVHRPFDKRMRAPEEVTSIEAVHALTRELEQKARKGYLPEKIVQQRENMMKLLNEIGNPEFIDVANRLTDHQFDVLWNYTDAATEITRDYSILKLLAAGEQTDFVRTHDDTTAEIADYLQWAQFLPEKPTQSVRKKRR